MGTVKAEVSSSGDVTGDEGTEMDVDRDGGEMDGDSDSGVGIGSDGNEGVDAGVDAATGTNVISKRTSVTDGGDATELLSSKWQADRVLGQRCSGVLNTGFR
jgi:hypothetical protein